MNLETLLEQEQRISDKISEALAKLKKWFENKIDEARAIFETIKEKVADKLRKVTGKGTLKKDVVRNGEKLASKGESAGAVVGKVKTKLAEVKKQCNAVIKDCKDGIKAVAAKNSEKAAEHKESVLKGLKVTAGIVGGVSVLVAAAVGIDAADSYAHYGKDGETTRDKVAATKFDMKQKMDQRKIKAGDYKEYAQDKYADAKDRVLAAGDVARAKAHEAGEKIKSKFKKEEAEIMEELLEQVAFIGEEFECEMEEDLYLEDFDLDLEMEFDPDYL